jgi:hypothetical protein
MVALPLKPSRGGFLRPFRFGPFVRDFLLGKGPHGSVKIDPEVGAHQAFIFQNYKLALMRATAMDRATRTEEKKAKREKRPIEPDNIESLAERYLARMPYKANGCRYHSFVVSFSNLQGWAGCNPPEERSPRPSRITTRKANLANTSGSQRRDERPATMTGPIPAALSTVKG